MLWRRYFYFALAVPLLALELYLNVKRVALRPAPDAGEGRVRLRHQVVNYSLVEPFTSYFEYCHWPVRRDIFVLWLSCGRRQVRTFSWKVRLLTSISTLTSDRAWEKDSTRKFVDLVEIIGFSLPVLKMIFKISDLLFMMIHLRYCRTKMSCLVDFVLFLCKWALQITRNFIKCSNVEDYIIYSYRSLETIILICIKDNNIV